MGQEASPLLPEALMGPGRFFSTDRESLRKIDRAAVEEFSLPSIVLMENAATALLAASRTLAPKEQARVLILCGPGNNGGDGLALARRLANDGARVAIAAARPLDQYKGDARVNANVVHAMDLPMHTIAREDPAGSLDSALEQSGADLLVDALLGTGLDKPPKPPYDAIIAWINRERAAGRAGAVLSVDAPSGLDCDTGRPLGEGQDAAVRADATVTLAAMKQGFLQPHAERYTGRTAVGDIGAPSALLERFARRIE